MPKIYRLFFVLLFTSLPRILAQDNEDSTSSITESLSNILIVAATSSASVATPSTPSASAVPTIVASPTTEEVVSTVQPCVRYHKTGFWDIDILNWELDPKICGPPLSINATTDKSRLPIEICAVIGAYLLLVFSLGTVLLTVAKRARKIAQGYIPPSAVEMMHAPGKTGFEPMSPTKTWFKKSVGSFKSLGGGSVRNSNVSEFARSPVAESVSSFDARVLRDDRESRAMEMERLYAAVMAHDEAKKSESEVGDARVPEVFVQEVEIPPTQTSVIDGREMQRQSPPRHMSPRQKPMRLNLSVASSITSDALGVHGNGASEAGLPLSPRTPRAIYPPGHQFANMRLQGGPASPRHVDPPSFASLASPTFARAELPNDMYPASPPPSDRPAMTLPPPRPLPPSSSEGLPLSPRRAFRRGSQGAQSSSSGSSRSRKTPNIKNLRIGGPISTEGDEDTLPLTPRVPPQNEGVGVRFALQPDTPQTAMTYRSDATGETDYHDERMDQPTQLPISPRYPPPSGMTLRPPPSTTTSPNLNPYQSPNPHSSLKSASSSTNALPFRAFQDNSSLHSPAATKTTFLERKNDRVGRGPLTARTPRTGVIPQTPYSAYMPFTPITPITPRLVGRKERKERIKAEGKKVIVEEDAVDGEGDMWE